MPLLQCTGICKNLPASGSNSNLLTIIIIVLVVLVSVILCGVVGVCLCNSMRGGRGPSARRPAPIVSIQMGGGPSAPPPGHGSIYYGQFQSPAGTPPQGFGQYPQSPQYPQGPVPQGQYIQNPYPQTVYPQSPPGLPTSPPPYALSGGPQGPPKPQRYSYAPRDGMGSQSGLV